MRIGRWTSGLDEDGVGFFPCFEIVAVKVTAVPSVFTPFSIQAIEDAQSFVKRRECFARPAIEISVETVEVCIRLVIGFCEMFCFFSVLEIVADHVELFMDRSGVRDQSLTWDTVAIGVEGTGNDRSWFKISEVPFRLVPGLE